MKPCATPGCTDTAKRFDYCSECAEWRWNHSEKRQAWLRRYARRPDRKEESRLASAAYRAAGKTRKGTCVVCAKETSRPECTHCRVCYRTHVFPYIKARSLRRINRKFIPEFGDGSQGG